MLRMKNPAVFGPTGLVIRDLPLMASNYRNEEGLSEYLQRHNIVAIAEIDTRRLTRILRDKGAQSGCLMAGPDINEASALEQARGFCGAPGYGFSQGSHGGRNLPVDAR